METLGIVGWYNLTAELVGGYNNGVFPTGSPLSELLAQAELGLTLVTGPADARYRSVRWAERLPDRAWLAPGDLRIALADEAAGAASHDNLLRAAPAVIVYALTPTSRTLPVQLASRVAAAGAALVTAPPDVAPEVVEVAALRGLVALTAGVGSALAGPQSYLLAGMAAAKPERDLLDRLNRLTGLDLVLVSPWGEVLARAGTGAWRPQAPKASAAPVTTWQEGAVRLGGRPAHLYRVEVGGRLQGVLLAFEAPEAARPWLELTRSFLTAAAAVTASEVRAVAAAGEVLLTAWLAAPSITALAPRLAAAGFSAGTPYQVAVADGGASHRAAALIREAGEDYFQQRGVAVLAGSEGATATFAFSVPGGQPSHEQAEALIEAANAALGTAGGARIGLSQVHSTLAEVAEANEQARLALDGAPPSGGLFSFDDVDPIDVLLSRQQPGLGPLQRRILAPLLEADHHGKLLATLTAYLAAPNDLNALAAQLGLHVNTLRYRLKRIEELVGAPLSSPKNLARLWLATRYVAHE